MKLKNELPRKWFGYSVKDTQQYLKKIEQIMQKEAAELEEEIGQQRRKYEQIREQSNQFSVGSSHSQEAQGDSLLSDRLKRSIEAIRNQGEKEVQLLNKWISVKKEAHQQRMNELLKKQSDYEKVLHELMEEASAWMEKIRITSNASALFTADIGNEVKETIELLQQSAPDEDSSSVSIYQMMPEMASMEQSMLEQTATKNEEPDPGLEPEPELELQPEFVAKPESAIADQLPLQCDTDEKVASFWDEVDDYREQSSSFDGVPDEETPIPFADPSPKPPPSENLQRTPVGSPSLSAQIKSVQNRYIVGKIAGETLFGEDGREIVAKGSIISEETISLAELEGKLPELIVNMQLPAFGEDEG